MNDTGIHRQASEADTEQVKSLWRCCFDDDPAFVDWYFAHYYKPENTLGIFENDTLLASAQVIPYRIALRGAELACGYVVGVDTAPEARGRGCARKLLHACLEKQAREKQPLSLLMPFEGQFYYRYGYPFCYFHQQIKTDAKELRCAAKSWGSVREVDPFAIIDELARIYRQYTADYDGYVIRSREGWQLLLEDGALEKIRCFVIEAPDAPEGSEPHGWAEGYLFWMEQEDYIFIREFAWCRAEARAGMLHFLMETVPQGKKLWLELPDDDSLVYQLAATKTAVVRYPFLMARIVDVKMCLEALPYHPQAFFSFRMRVKDAFAEWNDGLFSVKIQNGIAVVQRIEDQNCYADVTITINALSQLVMGTCSAAMLKKQNELACIDRVVSMLDWIWSKQHLYLNEYY